MRRDEMRRESNDNAPDTLFCDGQCPLCMREVRLLTQIADDGLRLTDLHDVPDNPGEPTGQVRLENLHLRTCDGEWLTGVDATVRAWSHTRWGFLFRMLRWPLIGPLADAVYRYWARRSTMRARCLKLGANTPWKRVRLKRGLGTRAANRAIAAPARPCARGIPFILNIKSSGFKPKRTTVCGGLCGPR
jgi:predicted DCC family thiol-disulfide oxidoreductase YuxK